MRAHLGTIYYIAAETMGFVMDLNKNSVLN